MTTIPELSNVRIVKPRSTNQRYKNIGRFALIEQGKARPLRGVDDLNEREQQYCALDSWCTLKAYLSIMERMEEKGWLEHSVQGRSFIYRATVPREESLGHRVKEMVEKACGGNPEKLMMALMDYRGLSEEESKRISQMLNEARRSSKSKSK